MTVTDRQLQIEPSAVTDPVAADLIRRTEAELCGRYGIPSIGVLDPAEFEPAAGGLFVVARLGDVPAGCGGYHRLRSGVAELKRLYVADPARRRGVARAVLSHLERAALAAGYRELWLETGVEQPEAIALYRADGYRTVAPFGVHAQPADAVDGCLVAHDSRSRFFGIDLADVAGSRGATAGPDGAPPPVG